MEVSEASVKFKSVIRVARNSGFKEAAIITDEERAAWEAQKDHLTELGFHTSRGISEQEYRASLPDFKPQPRKFKGRFDNPILVDPRIPLIEQLRLMNIHDGTYDVSEVSNYEGVVTPENPYQIWVQDGSKYIKQIPAQTRSSFEKDERGITAIEGFALLRENQLALPIGMLGSFRLVTQNVDGPYNQTVSLVRGARGYRASLTATGENHKQLYIRQATCGLSIAA